MANDKIQTVLFYLYVKDVTILCSSKSEDFIFENKSLIDKLFTFDSDLALKKFLDIFREQTNLTTSIYYDIDKYSSVNDLTFLKINTISDTEYYTNLMLSIYLANNFNSANIITFTSKYNFPKSTNDNWQKIEKLEYLYILSSQNYDLKKNELSNFKIGITNNLNNRFYKYKTHSPEEIKVFDYFPIINFTETDKLQKYYVNSFGNDWILANSGWSANTIEGHIKSDLDRSKIFQEWFYMRYSDIRKNVINFLSRIKVAKFKTFKFTDRYGSLFFIQLYDKDLTTFHIEFNLNKNIWEIFLSKEVYGNFDDNKIKKLKTVKNIEDVWIYLHKNYLINNTYEKI